MTTYKLPEPVAYELSATKYANGKELVYTVPAVLASYIKVTTLHTAEQMQAAYNQGRIDQRKEQEELERLYDSVRVAMNNERKAR